MISRDGLPPNMRFSRSASYNNPYEMFPSTSKLFSGFTSLAENVVVSKPSHGSCNQGNPIHSEVRETHKSQTLVPQLTTLTEEDDQQLNSSSSGWFSLLHHQLTLLLLPEELEISWWQLKSAEVS